MTMFVGTVLDFWPCPY